MQQKFIDVHQRPVVTEENIARWSEALHAEFDANSQDMNYLVQNYLFKAAFPNPGYGRTLPDVLSALEAVTPKTILDYVNVRLLMYLIYQCYSIIDIASI